MIDKLMNKKLPEGQNNLEDIDAEKDEKLQKQIDTLKEDGYHKKLTTAWKNLEANKEYFSEKSNQVMASSRAKVYINNTSTYYKYITSTY